MSITTKKYERIPLFVDAVEVTALNITELAAWCGGRLTHADGVVVAHGVQLEDTSDLHIKMDIQNPVTARQTKAFCGDWILKSARGYKIYSKKAFTNSFLPLDIDGDPAQIPLVLEELVVEPIPFDELPQSMKDEIEMPSVTGE